MELPRPHEISAQLEKMCQREPLVHSKRGCQLLRYLVGQVVRGVPSEQIKESVIGVEVFGLPHDYNPKENSIVRVSAGKLRESVESYYEILGRNDPVRIKVLSGSYIPVISYESTAVAFRLSDKAAMNVANAKSAFNKRTLPGHDEAFRYLELALAEHPDHPRILALKAMVHVAGAIYGRHPATELEAAAALIEKAKASEYESWERSLVEAELRTAMHFDWTGAEVLFNRAIELSHGEARYHPWHTSFLASQLHFDEALRILSEAVAHFGHDIGFMRADLALMQIVAGHLDDAEELLRSTLELFPKAHYLFYVHLAMLHEARGDFAKAVDVIEQVPITAEESTLAVGGRYLFIGLNGDREKARHGYEQLQAIRRAGERFIPGLELALAGIGAGDDDGAAAFLVDAALIERDPLMDWIAIAPILRHIHYHPVFRRLVIETMKLRFPDGQRASTAAL